MGEMIFQRAFKSYYSSNIFLDNIKRPTSEIVLYLSGKSTAIVDGKTYDCKEGFVYFNYAKKPHSHIGKEPQHYLCFVFESDVSDLNLTPSVYDCNGTEIIFLITKMWNIYKNKNYYHKELVDAILREVLILIAINKKNIESNFSINELIDELNKNNFLHLSVEKMAKMTSYSYDHFRHKFKEITKKSPKDFQLDRRIELAKSYISEKKYSFFEISSLCGFSSISQFNIQFKNRVLLTPKQFLKKQNEIS